MKKNLLIRLFYVLLYISFTQKGVCQVGVGTTTPRGALEISSSTSGLLVPQVALTASNVSSPVVNPQDNGAPITGTIVYNTATAGIAPNNVVPGFYHWNGSNWLLITTQNTASTPNWTILGNSGTNAASNFVGTTDANDFVTRTNNVERLRVTSTGNVGVGTSSPVSKLTVNGASTNLSAYNAGAGTTIDFSLSNLAYTTSNPGTAFTLNNIKDGGTYTLSVRGTTSGTATFSSAGFTFKSVNNGATTSAKETLYTFLVIGTTVYFYMVTGF